MTRTANRTARLILATGVALTAALAVFGGVASAAPAGGAESTVTTTETTTDTTTDTTNDTTTAETTITARDGDSLAGIAWRHGVRLSALLRANSLQLTSVIHPGDTLVIPAGAKVLTNGPATGSSVGSPPATSGSATATSSAARSGPGSDYTIRSGDALAGIAWRHGVTLGALVKVNDIAVTSLILPGQQLRIPPATRPIPTSVAGATTVAAVAPAVAPAVAAPADPAAAADNAGAAPASLGDSLQTLLSYATAQVGAPYTFFSAGPETFDCSGLVVAAFRQIGMSVPHQSRALARLGTAVDWRNESISAGDLVFTSAVNDPALITHVGIALDSHRWVHAVGFGRTVSIGTLPTTERIMAVQRIALP